MQCNDKHATDKPSTPLIAPRSLRGTRSEIMMFTMDRILPPPMPCTVKNILVINSDGGRATKQKEL